MPEHIHLLVNEPPGILLAQFPKAVKQMTSRKLKGGREKFWQERYYDSNVSGERARSEAIRYIHRNPGAPSARTLCAGVESRGAWVGRKARRLAMVELPRLRERAEGDCRD
jgi:hypothetical protein